MFINKSFSAPLHTIVANSTQENLFSNEMELKEN